MIKVLIVEDRKTVQEILKSHLETEPDIEIVDCVEDGQQAIETVKIYRPNIVLMDIEMPVLDGLSATRIITEQFIDCNVLILSVHDEDNYLTSALQAGAKGYLLKNTPARELINAIYSAHRGYFQLGPGLLEKYLHKLGEAQSNFQEIAKLKNMVSQQSKLLEELQNHSDDNDFAFSEDSRDFQERYISLEQQYYSLRYGLDNLEGKIDFIQKLCYFLVIVMAILIAAHILNG